MTCIARSACDTSDSDIEILNNECQSERIDPAQCLALNQGYLLRGIFPVCVTGTIIRADFCVAAGGILDFQADGVTKQCIPASECTTRTMDRQYINSAMNECVAACAATEGLDATPKTCLATPMSGAHCQANNMQVYNAVEMECELETTCTDRSGSGMLQFVDRTFQCVAVCPMGEGVLADKCVNTGINEQVCVNAGRSLREEAGMAAVCVRACQSSDGSNPSVSVCITSSPTPQQCENHFNKFERNGMCVDECVMTLTASVRSAVAIIISVSPRHQPPQ